MDDAVETWLDREHRLRSRAEQALRLLRDLWGELPPPSPDPQLDLLIDALAGDDDHGRQSRVVVHGDGVTYDDLVRLARSTGSVSDALSLLPPGLRERMKAADASPMTTPQATDALDASIAWTTFSNTYSSISSIAGSGSMGINAGGGAAHATVAGTAALPDERCGIWELDVATHTVTYDAICAHLLGVGDQAGQAPLPISLPRPHAASEAYCIPVAAASEGSFSGDSTAPSSAVHPDDEPLIGAALDETLRTGRRYETRFRVRLPDATYAWRASRARLLPATDSTPAHLVGFIAAED